MASNDLEHINLCNFDLPESLELVANKKTRRSYRTQVFIPADTVLFDLTARIVTLKLDNFCLRLRQQDNVWLKFDEATLFLIQQASQTNRKNVRAVYSNATKTVQVRTCQDIEPKTELYFDFVVEFEHECRRRARNLFYIYVFQFILFQFVKVDENSENLDWSDPIEIDSSEHSENSMFYK